LTRGARLLLFTREAIDAEGCLATGTGASALSSLSSSGGGIGVAMLRVAALLLRVVVPLREPVASERRLIAASSMENLEGTTTDGAAERERRFMVQDIFF